MKQRAGGSQVLQFLQAVLAYKLFVICDDILGVSAEDAGSLSLLQNDLVTLGIDLHVVLHMNVKVLPDRNGQYDPSQFIHLSAYAG